jgi:glyoxylase-like metal-dependent hydrolase (beta-lactamase superfamily II)
MILFEHLTASRRDFLMGAGGVALSVGLNTAACKASAAIRTVFQYRGTELLVVSDGHFYLPPAFILSPDVPTPERQAILAAQAGDRFRMPANIAVIRRSSEVILIDSGYGPGAHDTAGKLAANLKSVGIDPSDVTKIVLTHAHPDHLWGVSEGNDLAFPNASYIISYAEWDFWMKPDLLSILPETLHRVAIGARQNLARIEERITMIKPGTDIASDVRVIDTAGHTPGHVSVEIAASDGLLVTADALIHPAISLQHPAWRVPVDYQPDRAIATRRRLLDRLATHKMLIIGYHFPFPGLGMIERKDTAYRFITE